MASYQTVNLKLDIVARARAVADDRGIALATLLADLVNEAYEKLGHSTSKVALVETQAGAEIVLALQDKAGERTIRFPKSEAAAVAERITAFASSDPRERGHIDLDLHCALEVSRRGAAVVIGGVDEKGQSARETMSVHDATRLARDILDIAQ